MFCLLIFVSWSGICRGLIYVVVWVVHGLDSGLCQSGLCDAFVLLVCHFKVDVQKGYNKLLVAENMEWYNKGCIGADATYNEKHECLHT